ncbi:MAG: hypothetical protein ACYC0F_00435 [Rhodanobacter sp.]
MSIEPGEKMPWSIPGILETGRFVKEARRDGTAGHHPGRAGGPVRQVRLVGIAGPDESQVSAR